MFKRTCYIWQSINRFKKTGTPLAFPLVVQLQTQSVCNAECAICPYPSIRKLIPHGIMEGSLFQKVVSEIAQEKLFFELLLELQNEPLVDARIFELIKHFKSLAPGKKCAVITNGSLIDNFSIDDIACSGIDELVVSLNAHTEATYRQLNQGLDYHKVTKNIESLISDKRIKSKVVVHYVATRQNEGEIRRASFYWRQKGIRVRCWRLSNRAGGLDDFGTYKPSQKDLPATWKLQAFLREYFMNKIFNVCPFPFFALNILFNGDVLLCCNDWNRDPILGNIKATSLKEIWNSSSLNMIRRSLLEGRFRNIKPCSTCSTLEGLQ